MFLSKRHTSNRRATHPPDRTEVGEELPGVVVRHRCDDEAPELGGVDARGRRRVGHGEEQEDRRAEHIEEVLHRCEVLLAEDSVVGWRATGRRAGLICAWTVLVTASAKVQGPASF